MSNNRYVVIMAGGKGERFWPQSRLSRPKHLLPIVGDKPMLTQTVDRLAGLISPDRVLIVTNAEQRDAILEICPMLPAENVIAEPVGRDTAAAVGLSTLLVKQKDPQATFAMLPADHVVHDEAGFRRILEAAFVAAEQEDALITVGIKPDYPATGYGYIQRGEVVSKAGGSDVHSVKAFKEKPDEATARSYVESGNYYWNAGMFIWRVPVIAREFEQHTPRLWKALGAIETGLNAGEPLDALLAQHYPELEKISIDYAVMEKAAQVRVLESDFDWDDVGEWPAVARHFPQDDAGNVCRGEVELHAATGNIVIGDGTKVIALVGVDDLIVVQTADATLICPRDKAQDIKAMVKQLAAKDSRKNLL